MQRVEYRFAFAVYSRIVFQFGTITGCDVKFAVTMTGCANVSHFTIAGAPTALEFFRAFETIDSGINGWIHQFAN